MKCEYCGKELPLGTTVCDGCGAKMDNNVVHSQNSNQFQGVGNMQPNNNMQPNYNMQQPYYGAPKKSGTGLKVTIAILVVVIIALVGVGAWFLFGKGDDKEESSNTEKNPVEEKDEKDNNEKKEDQKPNNENLKTVNFKGYTLSVLDGFDTGTSQNNPYIYNDECLIMYVGYALDYDSVLENKDVFLQELEKNGMKVSSFNTKTIKGQKYVLIEGVMTANNAEFGYMITDLGGDTPILLTILSSTLKPFEEDWFDYGAEFVASARK